MNRIACSLALLACTCVSLSASPLSPAQFDNNAHTTPIASPISSPPINHTELPDDETRLHFIIHYAALIPTLNNAGDKLTNIERVYDLAYSMDEDARKAARLYIKAARNALSDLFKDHSLQDEELLRAYLLLEDFNYLY
jgi:hypothetical protein